MTVYPIPAGKPRIGSIVVGATLLVSVPSASDRVQRVVEPPQQPRFDAGVELVLVDVAVLGDGGVPVAGLTADDFRVEEDGESREVALLMNARGAPLDIALVIDLSGTMAGTPWRERAVAFLGELNPSTDCVYLMGFSTGIGNSMWTPPHDRGLLESMQVDTRGATALFDATVFAANEIAAAAGRDLGGLLAAWEADLESDDRHAPPPSVIRAGGCPTTPDPAAALDPTRRRRRALVIVTDGQDHGSRYGDHHARMAALAAGVPVFHIDVGSSQRTVGVPPTRSERSSLPVLGPNPFGRIVEETGGGRIETSANVYRALLTLLRGSYVIGYYVPRPAPGTRAEVQRHELRLQLRNIDGDLLYPRLSYRSTIDQVRRQAELAEARRQLERGDLDAAMFAADNAVAADPDFGSSRAVRAEILQRRGRTEAAADDALAAARLSPGDATIHQLAARLSFAAERRDEAWEQVIRAVHAGAAPDEVFDFIGEVARDTRMPEDFLARIEAPRVALVVGPSLEHDPFARAALVEAMRAVGNALGDSRWLGLTRRRADASFVLRVSDKGVDDSPPRRFRGRITVTSDAGENIYDEEFTLDDLDDAERCAVDLEKNLRDIAGKIAAQG